MCKSSLCARIHFMYSLSWERFDNHKLRCTLFPRCHVTGLVNTCSDAFYVVAGMLRVRSTQGEIHFVYSLDRIGLNNTG